MAMLTLTLAEAAAVLKTTEETVSAMIRNDGLPAAKVGRKWVLVDVDIVDWLRTRYGKCESTGDSKGPRGGVTSGTRAGELEKALARPTAKRRKSTPTGSKPNSGEETGSANVLPLRGIPR